MNHFEDPAIYGLTDADGRVFYVGRTSVNPLNRWWEHRYRAKFHDSPLYRKWREVGHDSVGFTVLERVTPGDDLRQREAWWIAHLIDSGVDLVNQEGRNGIANSMSPETRAKISAARKGRSTWIKGKTGEEAGWTEQRKAALREAARKRAETRQPRHGTTTEYSRYGCRCADCREAYSTYQEDYRRRTGRKKS